jgi:hypothetical protein
MSSQPRILRVGEEPPPLYDPRRAEHNPVPHSVAKAERPKGKRSSRGRFECINAFLDVTMANLDRAELAVWLLLWRDTKPDGLVRTSQADLARRAGCNPRTVRRALAALQKAGLLAIVTQGGVPHRVSVYRVQPLRKGDSPELA